MASLTTHYRRSPGIHVRDIDGELFLVPNNSESVFCLDPVGAGLWNLLSEPLTRPEILDVFAEAFPDVDPVDLAADIDVLLGQLTEAGFVEMAAP